MLGAGRGRAELLSAGSGVAGPLERVGSLPVLSHTQHYQAVPVDP